MRSKPSSLFIRGRRFFSCSGFTLFEIAAARISLFDRLLTKWRKTVFLQEIQLLDISPSDRVLHLGCGALPTASVFIVQEKNAAVTGIDNNRIAVHLAQSYIKKKQLSNKIEIEYGDGATYPIHDFDKIFIAINVWPINRVLLHLAETMKPTARILCKGSHHDIFTLLEKEEFRTRFSIVTHLQHQKSESFLLMKKE